MRALHRYGVYLAAALLVLCTFLWWSSSDDSADRASVTARPTARQSFDRDIASPTRVIEQSTTSAPEAQPISEVEMGGTVRGRVVDAATKAPIQEFRLELLQFPAVEGRAPMQPRAVRSDDGRFEWTGIRPDRWRLVVTARGYQRFELDGLQVKTGQALPDILAPLRRGRGLTGRVYDQSTGNGIANAQITYREAHIARLTDGFRTRHSFKTDSRGNFTLDGLPEGRVTLTVTAPEYADREIDVATGENVSMDIGLSAGALVAGMMTHGDGVTPVAGTVGLIQLDQGFGSTIDTQPNGEFAFRKLSPGRYRLIGRTQSGRGERDIDIAGDERLEGVVLAIQSGGTIRGLIRGVRARDLSRLSITVRRPNTEMTIGSNARIDEHGAYVLTGVQAGDVVVIADIAQRRDLRKMVEMPPNGDIVVDFDFPPGVKLSGYVRRDGEPVPNAMLLPERIGANAQREVVSPAGTGRNGEYAIEDLAQGEYVLQIGSYRSPIVRVFADTVFDIDIPLAAHFAGRVMASDDDVPIVDATVDIWSAQTSGGRTRLQASSDHRGEFALTGLQPGEFVLTVYKPGFEMYREELAYGSPISDRTIRLREARGVDVRIRDGRTDAPLSVVQVTEVVSGAQGLRLLLRPDANGNVQLPAALIGSGIAFGASGFMTLVMPRWDGQSMTLRLRPEDSVAPR